MVQVEPGSGQETILTPLAELRFFWVEDHWKHEIRSVGPSEGFPLIWSIEGPREGPLPARVAGPSYQKIEVRAFDQGARATLSGRSGPHHFSATYDVYEAEDGVVIDADVTDRCDRAADILAATYAIGDGQAEPRRDQGRLIWDDSTHHLILAGQEPTTISAVHPGIRSTTVEAVGTILSAGGEHRLRYRWRWTNEPDTIPPWRLS